MADDDRPLSDIEVLREEVAAYGMEKLGVEDLKKKRAAELEMLSAFKKNPSPETFQPLYHSYKPLVMRAAGRNIMGSTVPRAAHEILAAQSFLDATRTWDPKKGGFNTHLVNTVSQKGKRLNYTNQNIGYIPEARATKYQAYQTALHLLREELGREPSTLEIADEMALAPAEVARLQKEVKPTYVMREDISMVGGGVLQSDKAMQIARDIQYDLIPQHQVVLEHVVGINGRPSLTKKSGGADIPAIMKATKLKEAQIRSALKTISRKFKEHHGRAGTRYDIEEIYPDEVSGGAS